MLFLLAFFGPNFPPSPVHDPAMRPAEVIGLPYDAGRLAPWAPDQSSRVTGFGDTAAIPAPDPGDFTSMVQFVASSEPTNADLQKENMELRQRLEELEQLMKDKLSQPPVSSPNSAETTSDRKSVPGWTVELYPWNAKGTLAQDPKERLLTQNCAFTGEFAQTNPKQMHLYRFLAVYRAKEPGRYVFSSDMTCSFGHKCHFEFFVDDQPILNFFENTDGTRINNGLPLTAGDHRLEFRTWLYSNNFINYEPGRRYGWHVMVKGPADFTQREFRPDELFSVIPRDVNMSAAGCVQ